MPCDGIVTSGPGSPLGAPLDFEGMSIGHRLGMQPMEGWDCEKDGRPTKNIKRRWQRFGLSGAKLIWDGEVCAVRFDCRANPKQLYLADHTQRGIAKRTRRQLTTIDPSSHPSRDHRFGETSILLRN
jgi:NADPH2 dehydrogenase